MKILDIKSVSISIRRIVKFFFNNFYYRYLGILEPNLQFYQILNQILRWAFCNNFIKS